MDSILEQMRDIHGPDPVPWWPLASGWWVVLGVALLVFALIGLTAWWYIRRQRDWRVDARHRMRALHKHLAECDARTLAGELSEFLRRVAMARYGRDHCAGLVGEQWLTWLKEHDPVGFDWTIHGRPLLQLPYVPPGAGANSEELRTLVKATRHWVDSAPSPHRISHDGNAPLKVLRVRVRTS